MLSWILLLLLSLTKSTPFLLPPFLSQPILFLLLHLLYDLVLMFFETFMSTTDIFKHHHLIIVCLFSELENIITLFFFQYDIIYLAIGPTILLDLLLLLKQIFLNQPLSSLFDLEYLGYRFEQFLKPFTSLFRLLFIRTCLLNRLIDTEPLNHMVFDLLKPITLFIPVRLKQP